MLLRSCSIPPKPAGSCRSGVVQLSASYQLIMTSMGSRTQTLEWEHWLHEMIIFMGVKRGNPSPKTQHPALLLNSDNLLEL